MPFIELDHMERLYEAEPASMKSTGSVYVATDKILSMKTWTYGFRTYTCIFFEANPDVAFIVSNPIEKIIVMIQDAEDAAEKRKKSVSTKAVAPDKSDKMVPIEYDEVNQ